VQFWHRARFDAPREAITHHQFVSGAKLLHKGHQGHEIVAAVRITHDDIAAIRRFDPVPQRVAVATLRDINDPRTAFLGNLLRSIGAAVIRDQNLAIDAVLIQKPPRILDAERQCFRFVQAGHENRQFAGVCFLFISIWYPCRQSMLLYHVGGLTQHLCHLHGTWPTIYRPPPSLRTFGARRSPRLSRDGV